MDDLRHTDSSDDVSEAETGTMALRPIGVCAIGASAGGLEALQSFFDSAPAQAGIAYVVIQHLSPDYKSLMVELLARHTTLRVVRAVEGVRLEPDTVYLNPPKSNLSIVDGVLHVADQPSGAGLHLPIDAFFTSLATSQGENAVGVVLSGTGSDGTRGARVLKAEGGLMLVQDPVEAQFDGMPRSVVATGLADQVLSVADMPTMIVQFFARRGAINLDGVSDQAAGTPTQVQRIIAMLRDRIGTDFSGYKPNTIIRRIERRVLMHAGLGWDDYVRLLESSQAELVQLHRDLLINVTRFFRDDDAFRLLESRIIPDLLRELPPDQEVRVWVSACSTGEEAYSIVMLLIEALETRGESRSVRVFATDVDSEAVEFAAAGRYSDSIAADVTPERIARFFTVDGDGYRVSRALRDRVIFARHNLLKDPPLTRMDLVSCRNMLIYLGSDLQRRVIALLAYSLRVRGYLFLGASETVGTLASLFQVVDAKWKLYQALNPGRNTLADALPLRMRRGGQLAVGTGVGSANVTVLPRAGVLRAPADDEMLENVLQELTQVLALRCVVLDADFHLVHTFGDVGGLLQVPAGRSTLEIFRLLIKPLSSALRTALARISRDQGQVVYEGIEVAPDQPTVTLHVRPMSLGMDRTQGYAVFFQSGALPLAGGHIDNLVADDTSSLRVAQLERELQFTKENLQATIEELETSNEELQATNEELLASNEELQSTNEELQSVNEELQTVNAEFQQKISELIALNDDIENLLRSTGVGTLFIDEHLRIRKFTQAAVSLLNVMPQDEGRPLEHIASKLPGLDLVAMSRKVIASSVPESHELQMPDGMHIHLRVLPYLTREPGAHGAILSVIDVTEVKRGELRLQQVLDSLPASTAVLHRDGTIMQTNKAWRRFAKHNDASPAVTAGVGLNYIHAVNTSGDRHAREAAEGISAVLDGRLEYFELEYPCHSPTEHRFFRMQATALKGLETRGAIIQQVDISALSRKLERWHAWAEALGSAAPPGMMQLLAEVREPA